MIGTFTKNTLITLIARALNLILLLGASIIIARALGPEGKGIYSLAILLPMLLITFSSLGIGPASVFYIGKKKYPPKEVLGANIIYSFLISIFAVLIGLIIVFFFGGKAFPGVEQGYLLLALSLIPFQLFLTFVADVLLGLQKIQEYNLIQLIKTFIFLVLIAIFLLGLHLGIKAAIAAELLSFITACIFLFYLARREVGGIILHIKKSLVKDFLSYGSKIYFGNIASFFHLRVDMWMINLFLNPIAVGFYSIAVGLSEKIWLVSQSAGTILFPKVSSEEDSKRLKEFTPLICRNILLITILIAILLFLLSHWLIVLIYSKQFSDSILPFQILLIGAVMISGNRILTSDLSGRGRLKEKMYIIIGAMILNVILNILWIPKWGIEGAAWATVISYTVNFLLILILYAKISGNKILDIVLIKRSDFKHYKNFLFLFRNKYLNSKNNL